MIAGRWTALLILCACGTPSVATVRVEAGRSLEVGITEITQDLYESVTGANPSLRVGAQLPVDSVSWHEAAAFCNALSLRDGLQLVYEDGIHRDRTGWRLPTEREWTVLAGSAPDHPGRAAWHQNNAERTTHAAGLLEPNEWGLKDVFGNVWEWCDSENPDGLQADRGGGYRSSAALMTPAARGLSGPGSRGDDLGFRVVRTVAGNQGGGTER